MSPPPLPPTPLAPARTRRAEVAPGCCAAVSARGTGASSAKLGALRGRQNPSPLAVSLLRSPVAVSHSTAEAQSVGMRGRLRVRAVRVACLRMFMRLVARRSQALAARLLKSAVGHRFGFSL